MKKRNEIVKTEYSLTKFQESFNMFTVDDIIEVERAIQRNETVETLSKYFDNRVVYVSGATYREMSALFFPPEPYKQFLDDLLSLTDTNNHHCFSLKIHNDQSDKLHYTIFTIIPSLRYNER